MNERGIVASNGHLHAEILARLAEALGRAMKTHADVVIVGGGIMGLAIAYDLAKHQKLRDVVVLDQSYLCSGASGRSVGRGVRAQWSVKTTCG